MRMLPCASPAPSTVRAVLCTGTLCYARARCVMHGHAVLCTGTLGSMVQARWCKHGASMVQAWCKHAGASMVQAWCKHGASMVQAWCKHAGQHGASKRPLVLWVGDWLRPASHPCPDVGRRLSSARSQERNSEEAHHTTGKDCGL